jgi:hypothetical protein
MRKLILAVFGLYTLAAIWKFEEEEDGALIALSPFIAAIAIALLSRRRSSALDAE